MTLTVEGQAGSRTGREGAECDDAPLGSVARRGGRSLSGALRITFVVVLCVALLDAVLTGQEVAVVWVCGLFLLGSAALRLPLLLLLVAGSVLTDAVWGVWVDPHGSEHPWLHLAMLVTVGATACLLCAEVGRLRTVEVENSRLERRHRQLFDTMGEAVVVHDLRGRIVTANARFEELFGRFSDSNAEELLEMVHPDDAGLFVAEYRGALDAGAGTVDGRLRCRDGRYLEVRVASVLTDAYDEPAMLDVITDLSGLRELERHSHELAVRYRTLVESLNEAVVLHDAGARLLFANPRFEELFGFGPEEQQDLVLTDLLHPDDQGAPLSVRDMVHERGGAQLEFKMRTAAGAYLDIHCSLSRVRDGVGDLVLAVYSDVTELVASRQAAQYAQREAERANEAKTLLLSRVSHELRTPISPIIGYADLLRSTRPPSEVRLYAERVLRSGEQLLKVADDLLDLSRIQRCDLRFQISVHALRILCAQAVAQTRPLAASLGLDVRIEGGDCSVEVDPDRMRQVLVNLIANGLHHGRSDVHVRIERVGDRVHCWVIDTGPGIAPEDAKRVFEPFVQLSARRGGVGLGLSLVRSLVGAMGGTVRLQATPGGGATFCVVLPVVSRDAGVMLE